MASNQTANFGLNQWSAEDKVLREEFNADNAKIDAALAAGLKAVTGSYVGTGTNGASNPSMLDFADTLGRAPILVYIADVDSAYNMLMVQGMAYQTAGSHANSITWTDTGVRWYCATATHGQLNHLDNEYVYIAIG